MKDYRCPKCDKLLFNAYIGAAHIEVKCKCGALAIVDVPDSARAFAALDWHGGARGATPRDRAMSLTTSEE